MISVAVGIIIQNGPSFDVPRVLMCQRKETMRYPLKWEFPGGKVEPGESIEDCLHRELFEELGINAEIGKLYHRQHSVYPDSGTFDVSYHLVPSFSGTPINNVFAEIAWVPIPEITRLDILEGNKAIIAKLLGTHETAGSKQG
jgi:8-oxo-dGTP diphosphatase